MTNRNLVMLICLAGVLSAACHRAEVEPKKAQSVASAPVYKPGPQPTETELRDAIKRNYEEVVTIDNSQSTYFVTGDFNADGSEDVAVVVKPAPGKLAELNSEYVNWILEDPQVSAGEKKPRTAAITRDDLLLAVVHGYSRAGWRNPSAKQTYLLKNAVAKEFAVQEDPLRKGAVIREKLRGSDGVIYWTGAKYAWRPVG